MATATSSSRGTRAGGRQQKSTRSTAAESSSGKTTSSSRSRSSKQDSGPTVELPFVTAQFHKPDLHLPGKEDVNSAVETVRSQLPSRDQALFYGGLAAGAAFSIIEWPVAVAIGVGNALVQRTARHTQAE